MTFARKKPHPQIYKLANEPGIKVSVRSFGGGVFEISRID
jgi:hypothetical protein